MTVTITPEVKVEASFTNEVKGETLTWDEATMSWDDAQGTWDVQRILLTEESKVNATFTNESKT